MAVTVAGGLIKFDLSQSVVLAGPGGTLRWAEKTATRHDSAGCCSRAPSRSCRRMRPPRPHRH